MHIKLQPDELLSGYLGRVAWANCSDTAERPLRRQLAHRGVDAEGLHPVEMVAILHAVDVERLICGHTYWALLNCVGSGSLAQQIDQGLRGSKWSTFSRRSRPGAWLCTACVEEDLEFWGFSYWRRRHQIPGLYHCDKHTVPLGVVYEERRYLDRLITGWTRSPSPTRKSLDIERTPILLASSKSSTLWVITLALSTASLSASP